MPNAHAPTLASPEPQPSGAQSGALPPDPTEGWPSLEVLSLRYIHQAVAHTGNNKTRAARLLGIDRRTLNRTLARERASRRAASATPTPVTH